MLVEDFVYCSKRKGKAAGLWNSRSHHLMLWGRGKGQELADAKSASRIEITLDNTACGSTAFGFKGLISLLIL